MADIVDQEIANGRLEVVISGGAPYMDTLLKSGKENTIGSVIVDCTDFAMDEGCIAAELFTPTFYEAIHKLLKPGCSMSQQITHLCFTQSFTDRSNRGGFDVENIEIFSSVTPEYGGTGLLPLALCKKN